MVTNKFEYTPEITAKMSEDYKAGVSVAQIAEQIGASEKSVIAKLSSIGIYVKKAYTNKRGEVPVSKDVYIERIGSLLDIDRTVLDSLEKVTKQALILIEARIKELKEE